MQIQKLSAATDIYISSCIEAAKAVEILSTETYARFQPDTTFGPSIGINDFPIESLSAYTSHPYAFLGLGLLE